MTSREFCYWLQGFFELQEAGIPTVGGPAAPVAITAAQALTIQKHLALVFKHEIDPSYPSYPNTTELDAIHNPPAHGGIYIDEAELRKALAKTAEELRAELEKALKDHKQSIGVVRPSGTSGGGLIRC